MSRGGDDPGALPTVVGIGAMKAGTSSLHHYLDAHPDVAMSRPKELNFFFGPAHAPPDGGWSAAGNWHRGTAWYRRHFPAAAPARGETSPGYTSPDHEEAAGRMAAVVPDARLVYLVREPFERALSQYRHHRREGDDRRPVAEALLDRHSQYLARSRYHARLQPFLAAFDRSAILVLAIEDFVADRAAALRRLYAHVGVDPDFWSGDLARRWNAARDAGPPPHPALRSRFHALVRDDVQRLQSLAGRSLPWS